MEIFNYKMPTTPISSADIADQDFSRSLEKIIL